MKVAGLNESSPRRIPERSVPKTGTNRLKTEILLAGLYLSKAVQSENADADTNASQIRIKAPPVFDKSKRPPRVIPAVQSKAPPKSSCAPVSATGLRP